MSRPRSTRAAKSQAFDKLFKIPPANLSEVESSDDDTSDSDTDSSDSEAETIATPSSNIRNEKDTYQRL